MNKMIIKNDYIFIFLLALAVSVISFGLTQLLFQSSDIIVYKDIFYFFSLVNFIPLEILKMCLKFEKTV